jgi:hypothetical protein
MFFLIATATTTMMIRTITTATRIPTTVPTSVPGEGLAVAGIGSVPGVVRWVVVVVVDFVVVVVVFVVDLGVVFVVGVVVVDCSIKWQSGVKVVSSRAIVPT